jgi:hypothetical protein
LAAERALREVAEPERLGDEGIDARRVYRLCARSAGRTGCAPSRRRAQAGEHLDARQARHRPFRKDEVGW